MTEIVLSRSWAGKGQIWTIPCHFKSDFGRRSAAKPWEPVSETTTQSKHQWLAWACPGLSQAYVDGHRRHIGAQGIPAAYRLMPGPWLSPNRGFPVFRFARGPRQGLIWPVGCCVAMWGRGGACFPFLAPAWKTYVLHVAVYVPRVSPTYETCVFAADIRFFKRPTCVWSDIQNICFAFRAMQDI